MVGNIQSELKAILRETKYTFYPSKRYIIPRDSFDYIMNSINNNHNLSTKLPINNSQFLNPTLQDLKNNVDERKIVLLIFELMEYLHQVFTIDYIIQVNISLGKDNIIYIDKIKVFNNNEFNETNVSFYRSPTPGPISETYLKYPRFQFLKNNQYLDATSNKKIVNNIEDKNKEDISIISGNNNYKFNKNKPFYCLDLDSYKKIFLNPLGLKNPSIYCYMNCCLQILLSIPELNYYFFNKIYKQEQGNNNRTLISDDYSNFISLYQNHMNHQDKQMDLPPSMFDICNSLVPKGVMNDCEEFFHLLLQSIQEELNFNNNQNNINNNNRDIYSNNDEIKNIRKRWFLYRERNSSFIDSIFSGYLRSTVICDICQKSSYNYEPFMDLSVPIPKSNKSINSCLNMYFEVESIDCNYHCDNCNRNTTVSNKIHLLYN